MKPPRWYAPRFLLLAGALISITLLSRSHPDGLPEAGMTGETWYPLLFGLVSLLLIILFLRLLAQISVQAGSPSRFLNELAKWGPAGLVLRIAGRQAFRQSRLGVMLGIWGGLIWLFIWFIQSAAVFPPADACLLFTGDRLSNHDTTEVVRVLRLNTPDNNPRRYLRALLQLAREAHRAGASLIVAPRPGFPTREDQQILTDSIRATGPTILYNRLNIRRLTWFSGPSTWPTTLRPQKEFALTSDKEGMARTPFLIHWIPASWREVNGDQVVYLDVALAAAGVFRGYPDSLLPQRRGTNIEYGRLRVPVNSQGESSALMDRTAYSSFSAYSMTLDDNSDSLSYYHYPDWEKYTAMPATLEEEISAKIVWVDWSYEILQRWEGEREARLVTNILNGQLFTPLEWASPMLPALALLLSGLLTMRLRPATGSVSIAFLGIGLLAIGIWLTQEYHLLIPTLYPALACAFAGIVFPLAKKSDQIDA